MSPTCRLTTPLDVRMLDALTTVDLLMQLKLLPVLTSLSMLVESAIEWRERDMTDPTSQYLDFRQISFYSECTY